MLETLAVMRVHFVHRQVHDTVVIMEEGNLPLTRCPRCDLKVSRKALNGRRGRGRFPSSNMTTVSWTCRCKNCTRITASVSDTPGHHSTGHCRLPPYVKFILYILGPPVVWGAQRCCRGAAFPCRVIM